MHLSITFLVPAFQISHAEVKVQEAERSHADILHQLRKLEQCLTEAAEREGREEELKQVVDEQDKELRQLREQVRSSQSDPRQERSVKHFGSF